MSAIEKLQQIQKDIVKKYISLDYIAHNSTDWEKVRNANDTLDTISREYHVIGEAINKIEALPTIS